MVILYVKEFILLLRNHNKTMLVNDLYRQIYWLYSGLQHEYILHLLLLPMLFAKNNSMGPIYNKRN